MEKRGSSYISPREIDQIYYSEHSQQGIKNRDHLKRKCRSNVTFQPKTLGSEDCDSIEEYSDSGLEEGGVGDGEPLIYSDSSESEQLVSRDKKNAGTKRNTASTRSDQSDIDHTKTNVTYRMEMNAASIVGGSQEAPAASVTALQAFLPSPPAEYHVPNRLPSRKRKVSENYMVRMAQAAHTALESMRGGGSVYQNLNKAVGPGENTGVHPTPPGTKAYKPLTPGSDACGNTLNKAQGNAVYEMPQGYAALCLSDSSRKSQRLSKKEARLLAPTQEANEVRAQVEVEKSRVETPDVEKAALEEELKILNQNVINLRADLRKARDQANDSDRKLRESRQANDDNAKLLEETNKKLRGFDHLKAQILELTPEFNLDMKLLLLEQSRSNLQTSMQRLHSNPDYDRWRRWPPEKYIQMHGVEKLKREQALGALRDVTDRLEDVVAVFHKMRSVFGGAEQSGAAE